MQQGLRATTARRVPNWVALFGDLSLWVSYALMLGFVASLSALAMWLLKRGIGMLS